MAFMASMGFKKSRLIEVMNENDGDYINLTIEHGDKTDDFGNNLSVFVQQSKEEREAKAKRNYVTNGRVFWTDGKCTLAEKKQAK